MCRSIKTLRPPVLPEEATEEDIRAAALQFVRKVSGFRAPAAHNREVFERAVDEIAEATQKLLDGLEVRGGVTRTARTTGSAGSARSGGSATTVPAPDAA
ncbi:DUF2277 domain-containing protein [Streptomyces sp. NPDC055709]